MATPLSADRLLAALRAEGVDAREYRSWRTHERDDETGKTFGPVHGVVIHHTAGRDSLALCYDGIEGLPGPLCHTHLSKSGVASMISAGRANHAGSFAQNAHDAVLAEAAVHPRPDSTEPVDANDHYYGIEIENLGDGEDPYPAVQYQAAVRWAAAICRAHGWTADSVIGHKEGTRRKIDPSFDMDTFRDAVAARLAHEPGWNPGDEEDDPMAGFTRQDVHDAVWKIDDIAAPSDAPDIATNKTWQPQSYLKDTNSRVRALQKQATAQQATIDKLVDAVAVLAAGVGDLDPAAIVTELRDAIESLTVRLEVSDI
jgi:hypothetical protein